MRTTRITTIWCHCDHVQPNTLALVVIHAHMSDLLDLCIGFYGLGVGDWVRAGLSMCIDNILSLCSPHMSCLAAYRERIEPASVRTPSFINAHNYTTIFFVHCFKNYFMFRYLELSIELQLLYNNRTNCSLVNIPYSEQGKVSEQRKVYILLLVFHCG